MGLEPTTYWLEASCAIQLRHEDFHRNVSLFI